jgi:flagellar basal body P-ring protein FlgI
VWSAYSTGIQVREQLSNDVKQVVAVFFELSKATFETAARIHRLLSRSYELVYGDPERWREPLREAWAKSRVIVDDPADALATDA